MNILLVNDHSLERRELARFFSENGHEVEEAEDGKDGVKKFFINGSTYFDVIVTETILPFMTGIEMAKRINGSYLGFRIPILALTSDFEKDYKLAHDFPFNLILPKEISNARLLDFCMMMAIESTDPMIYKEA